MQASADERSATAAQLQMGPSRGIVGVGSLDRTTDVG